MRPQLEEFRMAKPDTYEVVSHFLDSAVPQVRGRYPGVYLDEELTAAFSVKERGGKGLLGITPDRKLIWNRVEPFVSTYGESALQAAVAFRGIIKGIGALQTKEQAGQAGEAVVAFLGALKSGDCEGGVWDGAFPGLV